MSKMVDDLYNDIKNSIISSNSATVKTNSELKSSLTNILSSYNDSNKDENELEFINILKSTKQISEIEKEINHEIMKPIDNTITNSFDINKIVSLFECLDHQFHTIPNPNTEIGSGKTITFLRQYRKKLMNNFKMKTKEYLDKIFQVHHINDDNIAISVNINSNSNTIELLKFKEYRDIITSTITDNFIKHAMQGHVQIVDKPNDHGAIIKISKGVNNNANKVIATIENIMTIFEFLINNVYNLSSASSLILSDYLSDYFSSENINNKVSNHNDNLINFIIKDVIISNITQLNYHDNKKSIISILSKFNDLLNNYSIKLNRHNNSTGSGIDDIIDNLDTYYYNFRTSQNLIKSRAIVTAGYNSIISMNSVVFKNLINTYPNITTTYSETHSNKDIYNIDSYQISSLAYNLMTHTLQLFEEIVSSIHSNNDISNSHAKLYNDIYDNFELFRRVVIFKYSNVIETIPKYGLIFCNDCNFLCANINIIATAATTIDANCNITNYVDLITEFRVLSETVLSALITEQENILIGLVDRVNVNTDDENTNKSINSSNIIPDTLKIGIKSGLKNALGLSFNTDSNITNSSVSYENATTFNDHDSAHLLIRHIENLNLEFENFSNLKIKNRVLGFLTEGVIRKVMKPLLVADDISEDISIEINKLFKLIQKVKNNFNNSISIYVKSWDKFIALTDLLLYSTTDIADNLSRRKFSSFTAMELVSLTKALFQDSPKRESLLKQIQDMEE